MRGKILSVLRWWGLTVCFPVGFGSGVIPHPMEIREHREEIISIEVSVKIPKCESSDFLSFP